MLAVERKAVVTAARVHAKAALVNPTLNKQYVFIRHSASSASVYRASKKNASNAGMYVFGVAKQRISDVHREVSPLGTC